ncbi:MAG: glycosyltransferase family 4 protein [Gammaproteobacteria bacterium]|nr:glycosyltransferase family 4 protein [Gammaproteobacteria bacterium]
MNICHVNLAKGFRGGERQTLLLIAALAEMGFKQRLICRAGEALEKAARKISRLNIIPIRKPFSLRIHKVKPADLIHVHEGRSGHFAMLAKQLTGIPYVITRRIPNRPKMNLITRQTYAGSSMVIVLSNAIKQTMASYDAKLRLEVIPSMLANLSRDQIMIDQLKTKYHNRFVIGHIGALVQHHKGQQFIIEAAKQLALSHPELIFLLIGSGKDEAALKQQAVDCNNIEFVGQVENIADYLGLFNCFVFPSLEEGLGSTLLDAMQFEVPIIASEVDGIPDIILPDETGLLIPPANAEVLAEKIKYIYQHPEQAKLLTKKAKIFVEQFEASVIAARVAKVYVQALKA